MSVYPCEDFAQDNNQQWRHVDDCLVCKSLEDFSYLNHHSDEFETFIYDQIVEAGEYIHNNDVNELIKEKCGDCYYKKQSKRESSERNYSVDGCSPRSHGG